MNKIKMNLVMMSLIIIILSFGVYANVIWTDLGTGRTDDLMFSSNYLGGDINFTISTESVANEYYPHVASSLDFENDNYIYQYGTSEIRVYDSSDLSLLSNLLLPIDIIGQPMITNVGNAERLDLVFVTDNTTNKFINFYSMNNGVDLTLVKVFEIDNLSTGQLAVPKSFCSTVPDCVGVKIASLSMGTNFSIIDFDTSSYQSYNHSMTFVGFPSGNFFRSDFPYYSSPIYMDDIVGDSKDEIIIGSVVASADVRVKSFDLNGVQLSDSGVKTGSYGGADVIQVYTGQIGSLTGSKEIIINAYNTQINRGGVLVLDSNLNEVYSELSGTNSKGHVSVGDVNIDGLNEMCYIRTGNVHCYDSSYTRIIDVSLGASSSRFNTLSEHSNLTGFLELITFESIFLYDNDTNESSIYNFTVSTDENAMVYTVELLNRDTSLVKDLLYVTDTHMTAYYSSKTGAVCGDDFCSVFESILTCPQDCLVEEKQETGTRCSQDSDCASDFCTNLKCALKNEGVSCDDNVECASGECNNFNVCTIPTTADKVSAIKSENGLDDGMADLIGLFIALGVAVFIFFLGMSVGGDNLTSIIWASMGAFFITTGALTIVEFMRPFILLGQIILGFIVMVVLLLTRGNN